MGVEESDYDAASEAFNRALTIWTVVQVQTGDNFQGFQISPENERLMDCSYSRGLPRSQLPFCDLMQANSMENPKSMNTSESNDGGYGHN